MLKVIICEDNAVHRDKLNNLIENTILREELSLEVAVCTASPEEVISYVQKNQNTSIYFLDVDLKNNINGIRLGETIREMDSLGFIIFVTTHLEMSYLAFKYKVEAMDYVIKDDEDFKHRVNSCILKAYNTYYKSENKNGYISIKDESRIINIKLFDILFIETTVVAHKICVHEEDRQFAFYGNLKDINEKLTPNFYRCHKSYIVNKDKIKEVDKKNNKIIMENGEECYVSFRYMKGLLA
ncbi:LytTR family DNA-binding domain-containing protein [Clostridium estertheticum]|uniref:LytR/AlgR family response regulator transcription factor n=1 Tax=Clostridium estertheticum TaxID=238834 RepID=UPI001C7D28E4|nr:LytTR family DNA-binding domain-containing protein [Clostridium estertheticum]MBX4259485.1 LytTR family DNA-binding domain-containing protein [Clostridium estertheticum]MCB2308305.1 LytTR family DNA-binding domain-containing protein [Clostridium estertheticum]MCB2346500.1 LytTR family DNA-binding domain-containing protein [Clostridium estertheticum]MCB2349468.1 LytTR family DNA-binding domain-containing protein [Clostridium estertheticum]WAG46445.1 LytTR family DNA-binding domain-containing